jgi:hypothetical protein
VSEAITVAAGRIFTAKLYKAGRVLRAQFGQKAAAGIRKPTRTKHGAERAFAHSAP